MTTIPNAFAGRFCWVDLAATDANAARRFYERLFDWTTKTRTVRQGTFSLFALGTQDVASFYQLGEGQLSAGVPSHWTPYVRVPDVRESAMRADALGAAVIVEPFDVAGMARIALIQDPVGAIFGLWQQTDVSAGRRRCAS
jgi:predicted enzyme related to lactoylglutathione lyase